MLLRVHVEYYGEVSVFGKLLYVVSHFGNYSFGLGDVLGPVEAYENFLDVGVADARDARVFGTYHAGRELGTQDSGIFVCGLVEDFGVAMFKSDVDEFEKRRVGEHSSFVELAEVHRLIVVVDNVADGLVPGVVCLDDHFPLMPMASGTTGYLHHLLEAAFEGAEVGEIDEVVSTDDANDTYIVEVQSFGDHLCAYEDVDSAVFKVVEDFDMAVLLHCGVKVHPFNTGLGEESVEVVFDTFGPYATEGKFFAVADGTFGRHGDAVSAIVAPKGVGRAVIDKRDVAMLALWYPMAVVAFYAEGVTSAVLEQDDLFVVLQRLGNVVEEEVGEMLSLNLFLAVGVFHVNTENLRQLESSIAMLHFHKRVFPVLGVIVGFHRGGGAAEYGTGLPQVGKVECGVACIVAGRGFILFVRGIVLLIDNYQAEILKREEEGAAGSEEYVVAWGVVVGVFGAVPNLGPLAGAETGVINPYPVAEIFAQTVDNLGGQRYLGKEEKRLLALVESVSYEFYIDFGLARGGHAVEESGARVGNDGVVGCLLLIVERYGIHGSGGGVGLEAALEMFFL